MRTQGACILPSLLLLLALQPSTALAGGSLEVTHLYNLSNFSGTVPFNSVGLFSDRQHDELYVADGRSLRVFNASGMEIFRFANNPAGSIRGFVVDEQGDVFTLNYSEPGKPGKSSAAQFLLSRWSYRGEPKGALPVSGVPAEFAALVPNILCYRGGRLYLVSSSQLMAIVTDRRGAFDKGYNFAALLEIPDADRSSTEISGFSVDDKGNMLLTVAVLARAFILAPDAKPMSFGRAGSSPGSFGVVAGIVANGRGGYCVADRLRNVVMLFDQDRNFLTEFGNAGRGPDGLVRPSELELDAAGRLYVSQLTDRGVSVFSMNWN